MEEETPHNNVEGVETESDAGTNAGRGVKKFAILIASTVLIIAASAALFISYAPSKQQTDTPPSAKEQSPAEHQSGQDGSKNNDEVQNRKASKGITLYLNDDTGARKRIDPDKLSKVGRYYIDKTEQKVFYPDRYLEYDHYDKLQLAPAPIDDLSTFSVYDNDGRYATDSTSVYAVLDVAWSPEFDFGVVEGADPSSFEPNIVEQFDVSQGNTFLSWIAKDANHVYYKYDIIEHADPESFVITENVSINKDKNNVYLWRKVIPDADPQTYKVLLDESAAGPGTVYGKDTNNFFVDYCAVKGVDAASADVTHTSGGGYTFYDRHGQFTVAHSENAECSVTRE